MMTKHGANILRPVTTLIIRHPPVRNARSEPGDMWAKSAMRAASLRVRTASFCLRLAHQSTKQKHANKEASKIPGRSAKALAIEAAQGAATEQETTS
jgi:hypothetical protein